MAPSPSGLRTLFETLRIEELAPWMDNWSERERRIASLCDLAHRDIAARMHLAESTVQSYVSAMCALERLCPPQRGARGARLLEVAETFRSKNALKDLVWWTYRKWEVAQEDGTGWLGGSASSPQLLQHFEEALESSGMPAPREVLRALARVDVQAAERELRRLPKRWQAHAYAFVIEGAAAARSPRPRDAPRELDAHGREAARSLANDAQKAHAFSALAIASSRAGLGTEKSHLQEAEKHMIALGPTIERVHAKAALATATAEVVGRFGPATDLAKRAAADARELTAGPGSLASAYAAAGRALLAVRDEEGAEAARQDALACLAHAQTPREQGEVLAATVSMLALRPDKYDEARAVIGQIPIAAVSERSTALATLAVCRLGGAPADTDMHSRFDVARLRDLLPRDAARVLAVKAESLHRASQLSEAHRYLERALALLSQERRPALAMHALLSFAAELARADRERQSAQLHRWLASATTELPDRLEAAHVVVNLSGLFLPSEPCVIQTTRAEAERQVADPSWDDQQRAHLEIRFSRALAARDPRGAIEHAVSASDLARRLEEPERWYALTSLIDALASIPGEGTERALHLLDDVLQPQPRSVPTNLYLSRVIPLAMRLNPTLGVASELISPIQDSGLRALGWAEAAHVLAREGNIEGFRTARHPAVSAASDTSLGAFTLARVALGHILLKEFEAAIVLLQRCRDHEQMVEPLAVLANEYMSEGGAVDVVRFILAKMIDACDDFPSLMSSLGQSSRAFIASLSEPELEQILNHLRERARPLA